MHAGTDNNRSRHLLIRAALEGARAECFKSISQHCLPTKSRERDPRRLGDVSADLGPFDLFRRR